MTRSFRYHYVLNILGYKSCIQRIEAISHRCKLSWLLQVTIIVGELQFLLPHFGSTLMSFRFGHFVFGVFDDDVFVFWHNGHRARSIGCSEGGSGEVRRFPDFSVFFCFENAFMFTSRMGNLERVFKTGKTGKVRKPGNPSGTLQKNRPSGLLLCTLHQNPNISPRKAPKTKRPNRKDINVDPKCCQRCRCFPPNCYLEEPSKVTPVRNCSDHLVANFTRMISRRTWYQRAVKENKPHKGKSV